MVDYKKERELQKLDQLVLKREILSEQEIKDSFKKMKVVLNQDGDMDIDKFYCQICSYLVNKPLSCKVCINTKVCTDCHYELYKISGKYTCITCKKEIPKTDKNFQKVIDKREIECE